MTFALGLASLWFIDGMKNGLTETSINLPKVKSEKVMVIFPAKEREIPEGGGGGGGSGMLEEEFLNSDETQ